MSHLPYLSALSVCCPLNLSAHPPVYPHVYWPLLPSKHVHPCPCPRYPPLGPLPYCPPLALAVFATVTLALAVLSRESSA